MIGKAKIGGGFELVGEYRDIYSPNLSIKVCPVQIRLILIRKVSMDLDPVTLTVLYIFCKKNTGIN